MADRCSLHVNRIQDFIVFCEQDGWMNQKTKGPYEAIRMKKGKLTLIVHRRDRTLAGGDIQHLSTWGESERMFKRFIRARKHGNPNPSI